MKSVILAAGKGSRMGELTLKCPKPLIKICGKELILYTLESLPSSIDEYIVVIKYQGSKIKSFLGSEYNNIPISYINQERCGTGGALYSARHRLISEKQFFVISADDIFGQGTLNTLTIDTATSTYGIFYGTPSSKVISGIIFDKNNRLLGRKEVSFVKPRHFGVGAYVLSPEIFNKPFYQLPNGEYSIPHSLHQQPFPVYVRHIKSWLPVNTPEELKVAERSIRKKIRSRQE